MLAVAKKPKPSVEDAGQKRRRNVVFLSLDDATEERLQRFIKSQRVQPDRAAVAFTALVEFLDRIDREKKPRPAGEE